MDDATKVKKGVWEDNVDAAGGEVKRGCEAFVTHSPADPKETLLHIAAKNGDAELVQWLEAHSKSVCYSVRHISACLKHLSRCRTRRTQLAGTDGIPYRCPIWAH